MRHVLWVLPILLANPILLSQFRGEDLTGTWSGELYQNKGGFADRFELFFDLEQIGPALRGTAFVRLGELMAEMKLTGTRQPNGSWVLRETEILRNNKAGLAVSWCMKQYELRISHERGKLVLIGPWWGNSEFGPCIPGTIRLVRRRRVASLLGREHPVDVQPHGNVHYRHDPLHGRAPIGRDQHAVSPSGNPL